MVTIFNIFSIFCVAFTIFSIVLTFYYAITGQLTENETKNFTNNISHMPQNKPNEYLDYQFLNTLRHHEYEKQQQKK